MSYVAANWLEIFQYNQLATFEDLWQLQLTAVDEGNFKRGGQSLVSRHVLRTPSGKDEVVYIKRQENYTCYTWHHPFSLIPTFEREFDYWRLFQQLAIGTYELVYFAKRKVGKNLQAILISRELPAMDLVTYTANPQLLDQGDFKTRCAITYSVAEILRKMHDANLQHGHLSPKHIFVGNNANSIQSYIIDMELMRKMLWKQKLITGDLARLDRRTPLPSLTTRMRFFKHYLGVKKLSQNNKELWRKIAKLSAKR